MSAVQLPYFSEYRNAPLTCPRCGWTGTFDQGAKDYFDFLMDCSCPACPGAEAPILAIVPYPTAAEWMVNKAKLSEAEKAFGDAQLAHQALFDAKKLRTADQLPDLDGEALELVWDQAGDETVILFGPKEVWKEPAVYEGYWRFEQVLGLLAARYGRRLRDMVPTGSSEYYLYGDKVGAPDIVEAARERLKGEQIA